MNSLSNQPSISVFVENCAKCVRVEGWPRRQAQGVAVGATGIVTPFGIPCSFFLTIRHVVTLYLTAVSHRAEGGPLFGPPSLEYAFCPRTTLVTTPLLWTGAFASMPPFKPRP